MKQLLALLLLTITLFCATAHAQAPQVGDTLPAFTMEPFALPEDATVIGLTENRQFTLDDIDTPYIMLEIIGVYCPICHEQAPSLTKLYKRLKKTKLNKQITMLGIAAGGTPMEVKYIRDKDYVFPVVHDTDFAIYNAFSEPKTPFTMIVDKQGKVLYAHLGIIKDINKFYKEIQALVK